MGSYVSNYIDSETVEDHAGNHNKDITSKEISENESLEDDKSATNEADAGQMDSSRHIEDAEAPHKEHKKEKQNSLKKKQNSQKRASE